MKVPTCPQLGETNLCLLSVPWLSRRFVSSHFFLLSYLFYLFIFWRRVWINKTRKLFSFYWYIWLPEKFLSDFHPFSWCDISRSLGRRRFVSSHFFYRLYLFYSSLFSHGVFIKQTRKPFSFYWYVWFCETRFPIFSSNLAFFFYRMGRMAGIARSFKKSISTF